MITHELEASCICLPGSRGRSCGAPTVIFPSAMHTFTSGALECPRCVEGLFICWPCTPTLQKLSSYLI